MKEFFKKAVVMLLRAEARAVLRRYDPRIVAITGSVGKTATKDAIYSVVSQGTHTRKSEKSFNSDIGLPLTILGRPNAWSNPLLWLENLLDGLFLIIARGRYPEWLVLEVGADRPGDIKQISKWLPVDVAVITRLPEVPVHVEFFDSPEAVIEEKASLIEALRPSGTLVLFSDDPRTLALSSRRKNIKIVTFGFDAAADVRASGLEIIYEEGQHREPLGMKANIHVGNESAPLEVIGALGAHAFLPALAAAAVGAALGKSFPDILEALRAYTPPSGRMRLLRGIKNTTIIDDTYNSSPAAAIAALDALSLIKKNLPMQRTIAIMGDMLELGRFSVEEHKKLGTRAGTAADLLMTVGFRARDIAEGARGSGMGDAEVFQYEDAARAGREIQNMLREGDTILVKGSQSMRLERVVEEILEEPRRAKELLVRQDEEWKKR